MADTALPNRNDEGVAAAAAVVLLLVVAAAVAAVEPNVGILVLLRLLLPNKFVGAAVDAEDAPNVKEAEFATGAAGAASIVAFGVTGAVAAGAAAAVEPKTNDAAAGFVSDDAVDEALLVNADVDDALRVFVEEPTMAEAAAAVLVSLVTDPNWGNDAVEAAGITVGFKVAFEGPFVPLPNAKPPFVVAAAGLGASSFEGITSAAVFVSPPKDID